jgi:hypothetical protein
MLVVRGQDSHSRATDLNVPDLGIGTKNESRDKGGSGEEHGIR